MSVFRIVSYDITVSYEGQVLFVTRRESVRLDIALVLKGEIAKQFPVGEGFSTHLTEYTDEGKLIIH